MKFNILDLLLPKETKFFTYMSDQVTIFKEGCIIFKELVHQIEKYSEEEIKQRLLKIKDCELRGDKIEHQIIDELHKTFITPIDREDIHTFTINVDKSLDILNSTARKFEIYRIRNVPQNVCNFADIIVRITEEMEKLVHLFSAKAEITQAVAHMHTLENEADELFHASMAELFSGKYSPIDIIKLKEIFEQLESVVDSTDYIGKLIRGIKVKQG